MPFLTPKLPASRAARNIMLSAAALIASLGAVAAKDRHPPSPEQYYGLYANQDQGPAVSRWDRARFDHSGTRGREGLGASPMHPEGPGNVSD